MMVTTTANVKKDVPCAAWSRHRGPVTGVVLIPWHALVLLHRPMIAPSVSLIWIPDGPNCLAITIIL